MTSSPFGQPAAGDTAPPKPVPPDEQARGRRPIVIAAAAVALLLAAAGTWFVAPSLFGGDEVESALPPPAASAPTEVEPETDTAVPRITEASGRNPFLAAVGGTGTASGDPATVGATDGSSTGSSDVISVPGPAGADGVDGLNGLDGLDGLSGASGAEGAAGASGASGTEGLPGAAGLQGTEGPPGAQGAPGAQGPAGSAGASVEFLTVTYRGERAGEEVGDEERAEFELVSQGGTEQAIVAELAQLSTDETSPASAYRFYDFEGTDFQSVRIQLGTGAFYLLSLDQPVTFAVPVAAPADG